MLFNMALIICNINYNSGEVYADESLVSKGFRLQMGHLG